MFCFVFLCLRLLICPLGKSVLTCLPGKSHGGLLVKPGSPVPRAFSALGLGNCLVRNVVPWMWPSRATMWCCWHGLEPQRQGAGVKELGHGGTAFECCGSGAGERELSKSRVNSSPQCLVSYLSVQYPSAMMLCTMLRCKPGGLFRPEL